MSEAIQNLIDEGAHIFGEILDKSETDKLYQKMLRARLFNGELFLTENEYLQQKDNLNANPSKTFNFLNEFEEDLQFIENEEKIKTLITSVLGDDYEVVIKKAVCGVPDSWLPEWVRTKIKDVNVANLGPYIKKQYRDITYFRGIDFHQDIIDWPKGKTDLDPSKFLTLYIYLHDVTELDSPLHIIPYSHKLGATLFPHKLEREENNDWIYQDDNGSKIKCNDLMLTGKAGYVGIWHNCTLHGTRPVKHESEKFRLSLRYLIGKSNENNSRTLIDEINSSIQGDLKPIRTRKDLDEKGVPIIKGNIINAS